MNVILLGYRGSGKTTLGRALAGRLGYGYVDVDDATREAFDNATIAEIWRRHGEPAWRRAEVEATVRLLESDNQVIGLGGGTLMQPAARQAVARARDAVRIYLHAPAAVLHERIAADAATAATRPSLTALGGSLAEIEHVLAEREPVYRAVADAVVDVAGLGVDEALAALLAVVPGRGKGRRGDGSQGG